MYVCKSDGEGGGGQICLANCTATVSATFAGYADRFCSGAADAKITANFCQLEAESCGFFAPKVARFWS